MYVQLQLVKKEAMNLKQSREGIWASLERGRGKGRIMQLYYNVKTKQNTKIAKGDFRILILIMCLKGKLCSRRLEGRSYGVEFYIFFGNGDDL